MGASKKPIKDPNISISLLSKASFFDGSLLTHQSGPINHAPGVNTWQLFKNSPCVLQGWGALNYAPAVVNTW
jgi:hypothetical protein